MNKYIHIHNVFSTNYLPFYKAKPYLSILSETELLERIIGLIDNIVQFDWDWNFTIFIDNNEYGIAFMDTMCECDIRGIDPDMHIQNRITYYKSLKRRIDKNKINSLLDKISNKSVLFKYINYKFKDFWLDQNIRFCSSAGYYDKKYDSGILDNEIVKTSKIIGLRMINQRTGQVKPLMDSQIHKITQEYYISCFSLELSPKLFVLLSSEYDTCIVIENANEYIAAVKRTVENEFDPPYIGSNAVEYVDENRRIRGKKEFIYQKNYKFSFEKEYRLVFAPVSSNIKERSFRIIKNESKIYSINIEKH